MSGLAATILTACSYDEELGPNELLFVSSRQMAQLARPIWSQLLERHSVLTDADDVARVERAASRVVAASNNDPSEWEVAILQSDAVDIVALPNKKIAVHSGLLSHTENDDQLAAAIALAVAHVNYNHYGERYTRSPLADKGLTAAQVASAYRTDKEAVEALFGVNERDVQLIPFSRDHTVAADKFAVRYVARANYDPHEAGRLWRMLQTLDDPRFAQSHPIDETRLRKLVQEINLLSSAAGQ